MSLQRIINLISLTAKGSITSTDRYTNYFFSACNGTKHYLLQVDNAIARPSTITGIENLIQKAACNIVREVTGLTTGPKISAECVEMQGDPPLTYKTVFLNAGANTTSEITNTLRCLISTIDDICEIKEPSYVGYVALAFILGLLAIGVGYVLCDRYKERCSRDARLQQRLLPPDDEKKPDYGSAIPLSPTVNQP